MIIALALRLGRTPDELENTLTHTELIELAAYTRINGPLLEERLDWLFAGLCHVLYAVNGGKGKAPADFLMFKPQQPTADLEAQALKVFGQLGIEKRNGS